MAQKMTLTGYLAQRGVKAKALTKAEAELLGIPFPLQAGWARKHGATLIEEEMLPRLVAHAEAARRVADEKRRAKRAKPRTPAPADVQLPLVIASARIPVSPVPGFALRQARRYRGRGSI